MAGDVLSLTGAVLTVICVLILAYWCSRMLGKSWLKSSSGRNIKILERLQVGNDKQLLLIKVQEHVYLIGVSSAGISLLTEIEGDFDEPASDEAGNINFLEILKTHAAMPQKKKREDK